MSEAFDDETEQVISIKEYLKEVEEQEMEADLVLGGDEGKECTYIKGYMKRQAIFSCLTCTPDGNAGVCTACSLSCHDGHEIVELWTKRNFRCDCGNSKFRDFSCKLFSSKDVENANNSYNHNFKGLYCTCNHPYPDPDVEEQEDMIQCCICEDWFHEEHIGLDAMDEIPRDEDGEPLYEDFICMKCSSACSFTKQYPAFISEVKRQSDVSVDLSMKNDTSEDTLPVVASAENGSEAHPHALANMNPLVALNKNASKDSHSELPEKDAYSTQSMNEADETATCLLGTSHVSAPTAGESKAMFLLKNWRGALCRCEKCINVYNINKICFLLDEEDSIAEYEKIAKQKREEKIMEQESAEIKMFEDLGHVKKIEILNGIADMKNEIRSFLESYDPSKPITTSDVHQVFENLARKRRRDE